MVAPRSVADDRLSELVAHLSGAPLERSRAMVGTASMRPGHDELSVIADALLRLGCGISAPKRNASMRLAIAEA